MTNLPDSGPSDSSDWSAPGGAWGPPDSAGYSAPGGSASSHEPGPHADPSHPNSPGGYGPTGGPTGSPAGGPPAGGFIPTQPGIIPLQPLRLGQIYDGAFKAIRSNPIVMFVFAGVVVTVVTVIQSLLSASFLTDYFSILDVLEQDPTAAPAINDELSSMLGGSLAPLFLGSALTFIATTILNGVLTLAVSQAVLGFKPSLGQVWQQAKGQLVRLLGLVLLIGIITAAVPALLVGLVILAAASGSFGLAALIAIVAFLGSLAWLLFIVTATALATPALMLERSGVLAGLRRGWQLAKPSFWRVFGIYFLTMILGFAVSSILAMPVSVAMFFLPPTGIIIAQAISTAIASALITPFTAGVLALVYIDIRIRREGLAAELAAAAQ